MEQRDRSGDPGDDLRSGDGSSGHRDPAVMDAALSFLEQNRLATVRVADEPHRAEREDDQQHSSR